jgi:hypothetical protein
MSRLALLRYVAAFRRMFTLTATGEKQSIISMLCSPSERQICVMILLGYSAPCMAK